jgi:hypothetical protein
MDCNSPQWFEGFTFKLDGTLFVQWALNIFAFTHNFYCLGNSAEYINSLTLRLHIFDADRCKRDDQLAILAIPLGSVEELHNFQRCDIARPLLHPKDGFMLVPESSVSLSLAVQVSASQLGLDASLTRILAIHTWCFISGRGACRSLEEARSVAKPALAPAQRLGRQRSSDAGRGAKAVEQDGWEPVFTPLQVSHARAWTRYAWNLPLGTLASVR